MKIKDVDKYKRKKNSNRVSVDEPTSAGKAKFFRRNMFITLGIVILICILFTAFICSKSFFNPLTFQKTNVLYRECSEYRKPMEMVYFDYNSGNYLRFRNDRELYYIYTALDKCEYTRDISDYEPTLVNGDLDCQGTLNIISAAEIGNDKNITFIEWYGPDFDYINIDIKSDTKWDKTVKRVFMKIPEELKELLNSRFAETATKVTATEVPD